MTHDVHDSPYAWLRLLITLLIATIANVGIWAVVVILPDVEAEFGASRAAASAPYTLTMVGFAAGNMVIGRLVDRFGVTLALSAAAVLSGVSFALSALSPNIVVFSVLHLFLGLGTGVGFGPLMADISHWFIRRGGIAVAITASGNYLSGAIWPLLMSGILADGSWRQAYLLLGLVSVVGVIPLSLLLRRKLPETAQGAAEAAAALRSQSVGLSPRALQYLLGLAGIGCCVAMSMPQVHIVAYCVGLGYGPAVGAEMLSLMLLRGGVSRIVLGLLADRLGGVRTLLLGSVLQCIALFFYLPYDGMVSLYVVSAIFGLSQGGIVPSYALVVREYMPAREAGARVGFVIMMTVLGMAIGGWLSGAIYGLTGSYFWAFLNGIVWNFVNIGIVLMLLIRSRPREQQIVAA